MTSVTATPVYRSTFVNDLSPRCNGGGGGMSFDDVASSAAAAAAAAVISAGSRGTGFNIPVSMAMQASGVVGERRERVLLRPWLESLINSGSVPGLEWIDEPKTTFKVPWKHRSKKNWSLLHSCVFLEWAKNTGRWVEGDPEPNYAQLKTRLRCAFNKAPDIQEMKALHVMKCDEPYKVYRFIARRDGKLRPFPRTCVTRASIPLATRRRRRRFNIPSSSGVTGSQSATAPVNINIKYEPGTSSCNSTETLQLKELYENGQYYSNNEFARTRPEQLSRSHADLSDLSQDKRHRALLTVETKIFCNDTKPMFPATSQSSQPRRRILPEADDFFPPSCSVSQFRSPIVSAASAVNNVRNGIVVPHSRAVNEYHGEMKKHSISATEYFNNLQNNPEMQSFIPQRHLPVATPTMPTTLRSSESTRTSAEYYDDSLLPKSSPSVPFEHSQSVMSLSPVSSNPESYQPCDDMPSPVKRELPTSRVIESVSAPRHLHFKKAILQSQQFLEQQQHLIEKEMSEISCKKTEVIEECVSEKNSTQTVNDQEVPPKAPVARTLPVVAITNSIASLTVGRQSMTNGKVQEQIVLDNRYENSGEDIGSYVHSHLSSYRYQAISDMQRLQEERAWFTKDWRHSGQKHLETERNVYEMKMNTYSQQKPSLNHGISAGQQASPVKYKDHLQEVDFIKECEMRTSLGARVVYPDSYISNSGCTEANVCSKDALRKSLPIPNAVDLTYSCTDSVEDRCDHADVIDLSLRTVRRLHLPSEEYQMSSGKIFDHQLNHRLIDSAASTSDLNQIEARLKHETEIIANKSAILVSRERQLQALEQQLAAREEALTYHHRRLSTSPDFSKVSSNVVRMLPYTSNTGQCQLTYPATVSQHTSHVGTSENIDSRYYRLIESGTGNEGDNNHLSGDFFKAKRARIEDHFDSSTAVTVMHQKAFYAQDAHETNGDQVPVVVHRRVSSTGSENIPSPTKQTSPSTELDWSNTLWSKHSSLSTSQLEGLLMARKRGRPRGSRNRSKFELVYNKQPAMMPSPPMSNDLHWAHNVSGVREPTVYNEFLVDKNHDVSQVSIRAPDFRSPNSNFGDRITRPMDSTDVRSPVFSGERFFAAETRTAEFPPTMVGGVSASIPATVRQLVKSAAGTTGASILPPLSPCLDSDRNSCFPRQFIDSNVARRLQNATTIEIFKGDCRENYYPLNGASSAMHSAGQPQSRYVRDDSVGQSHHVTRLDHPVSHEMNTFKQWSSQERSACHDGSADWRVEPSVLPDDAERKMFNQGAYNGCEARILPMPNFSSADCRETWGSELGSMSAVRSSKLDVFGSECNEYISSGRLVIDVQAE